jgi:hypothetical protein
MSGDLKTALLKACEVVVDDWVSSRDWEAMSPQQQQSQRDALAALELFGVCQRADFDYETWCARHEAAANDRVYNDAYWESVRRAEKNDDTEANDRVYNDAYWESVRRAEKNDDTEIVPDEIVPDEIVPDEIVPDEIVPNVWMGMHHPEWMPGGEEESLISSGEYWTHTPNAMCPMEPGDTFVMNIKTLIGKRGNPVKSLQPKNYLRKGKITTAPVIATYPGEEISSHWYVTKIDWDPDQYPLNPNYKVGSCLAIRKQN